MIGLTYNKNILHSSNHPTNTGDRYELLPIVGTALVMRIPIAHISGGDITEGAIDNEVRNAVTMMSTLHFPGTQTSAARIGRMIGTMKNVFVVRQQSYQAEDAEKHRSSQYCTSP